MSVRDGIQNMFRADVQAASPNPSRRAEAVQNLGLDRGAVPVPVPVVGQEEVAPGAGLAGVDREAGAVVLVDQVREEVEDQEGVEDRAVAPVEKGVEDREAVVPGEVAALAVPVEEAEDQAAGVEAHRAAAPEVAARAVQAPGVVEVAVVPVRAVKVLVVSRDRAVNLRRPGAAVMIVAMKSNQSNGKLKNSKRCWQSVAPRPNRDFSWQKNSVL